MPLVILLIFVALGTPVHAQDAISTFPQFCEAWMEKLQARETRNLTNIKWETAADGVSGTYIGYSQEHTCATKNGTHSVQVGKITYRQVRYEKHGVSVDEALNRAAQPLDITEITEIFRYSDGRWVY